jgi:Lar family restriction alleviation protein
MNGVHSRKGLYTMTDELKACPFCGSENVEKLKNGHGWNYVHCNGCGAEGSADLGESGAIEAWNARPIEDTLLTALEDLLSVVNVRIDDPRIAQFDNARAAITAVKRSAS